MKEEQKISLDGFLIFLAIVFAVFLVLSMLYEFYPRNTIVDGLLIIDLFLTNLSFYMMVIIMSKEDED